MSRPGRRPRLGAGLAATGAVIALSLCALSLGGCETTAPLQQGEAAYNTGDYASALQFWKSATAVGDVAAEADMDIAALYEQGQGVPQDYAQAAGWYRKAADRGNPDAQINLGSMYAQGLGVPQDQAQSALWYRKAADTYRRFSGRPDAQYNLGLMYAKGLGVPQDDKLAAGWFQRAARGIGSIDYPGHPDAQYDLGLMYAQGLGVPKDARLAAGWYRKAADQGSVDAQLALGVMYYQGQGVPQDYKLAANWLGKAADQGSAAAQSDLGVVYELGQGVAQDYAVAASWFRRAIAQGYADARSDLTRMEAASSSPPQKGPGGVGDVTSPAARSCIGYMEARINRGWSDPRDATKRLSTVFDLSASYGVRQSPQVFNGRSYYMFAWATDSLENGSLKTKASAPLAICVLDKDNKVIGVVDEENRAVGIESSPD